MTKSPGMFEASRPREKTQRTAMTDAGSGHLYYAIKARVIAYDFPQGKRIIMERLAEKYGVSTWPVREVMKQLAAEGLVIKAPNKGFIAMTLSGDRLMDEYELTRSLLTQSLCALDARAHSKLPENEPIAEVLNKLNRRLLADVNTLATYTAEIFHQIALLSGNAEVVHAIDHANDHLHYIRTVECQPLEYVQTELMCFCELLFACQCEELISAIGDYHDQRVALLPELLEIARR